MSNEEAIKQKIYECLVMKQFRETVKDAYEEPLNNIMKIIHEELDKAREEERENCRKKHEVSITNRRKRSALLYGM